MRGAVIAIACIICADASLRGLQQHDNPPNASTIVGSMLSRQDSHEPDGVPNSVEHNLEHEITGVANTLMEDHFDISAHFAWTVVTTDDGDTVQVDTPHGQLYYGQRVRWVIRDKTDSEQKRDRWHHAQRFPHSYADDLESDITMSTFRAGLSSALLALIRWMCVLSAVSSMRTWCRGIGVGFRVEKTVLAQPACPTARTLCLWPTTGHCTRMRGITHAALALSIYTDLTASSSSVWAL